MIDFNKEIRFKNGTYTKSDCKDMTAKQVMRKVVGKKFDQKKQGVSRADCFDEMINNPLFEALIEPVMDPPEGN